jgi:putative inorganic carbon (HCO3(-)) transporter
LSKKSRDLVLLILIAPVLIVPEVMPWLTAGVLIVVTPVAIVRLLAARGSTALAWPVIGVLSMALVGTAVSPDRAVSLQKLAGIVLGALAFAAVQARGRSAGGFAAAMILFVVLATVAVAAAGAAALLPAVQRLLPARAALQRTVPAAATVHPNGLAGLILLAAPGLLLLSASRAVWARTGTAIEPRYRTRWTRPAVLRLGTAALCLAMLATLVASRSRSGILGLVAAIGLVLAIRLASGRASRRVWVAVSAALIAGVVTAGSIVIATGSRLPADLATRVDIWNRAVMMIGAFPLTGVGLNAFRSLLPLVAPSSFMSPAIDVAHAHNIFLQIALDLGLPGLCAYVALLGVALAHCVQIVNGASPVRRDLALALAANIAAVHLFGLTDAVPLGAKVGLLFWISLGLLAALYAREHDARRAVVGAYQ